MPRKINLPFPALWRALGGPELMAEYRFHPVRRWRFDYAYISPSAAVFSDGIVVGSGLAVAIELEGGVWMGKGARHTSGKGYLADCEKYNEAARRGWVVQRLGTGMITPEHVQPIIDLIKAGR